MAALFIAQVQVDDADAYGAYSAAAGASIGTHSARPKAITDDPVVVEGSWHGPRTIVLEFDDVDAAKAWYYSDEYQEAKKLRESGVVVNAVIVPCF
ncbi:MAG: DUF1330 domain-containing protein [Acidimicrobiales bacterium]|nr:DUF1330 domain-containing protein [Acidimicrobiales bacterium]